MAPICELRDVGKSYRGRPVVAALTLAIRAGDMVAITGPSGSGKSTILNLMGLLEVPDSGTLELFGAPAPRVKSRSAGKLLRERIGYLFQNYALIDSETVDYNLQIAQQYVRESPGQKRERRTRVLERVGLSGAGHRRVYELSGGEQQRVAIARLLLKPCDLVLADEPTGSLDAGNRDDVLRMLAEMNASGKTVVIVTHDPAVASMCDRVIDLAAPVTVGSGASRGGL
jgi:putative ABC transport system ATP-binding protein